MFLLPRLVAAATLAFALALSGAAIATQPVPAIDVSNSPTKKTGARILAPVVETGAARAPKPTDAEPDSPERLRHRLTQALAAVDANPAARGTAPPPLQIVNRREPNTPNGPPAAATPRRNAPLARSDSATRQPSVGAAERLALVPGSTARLAAVQSLAGRSRDAGNSLAEPLQWAYDGPSGPHAWAELRQEYARCGSGQRQSPIDLRDGIKLQLESIAFSYQPSAIRVVDTGHTIQVDVASGNWMEVMGRRFELRQFHFHKPSEERIDGRRFDMGAHLVHRDHEGRLAIVAVLLNRGAAQPLIQAVWNNLPLERGSEQPVAAPIDPNALLPVSRGYFAYMGSLAEPPCTEDVLWLVLKTPVDISPQQIAVFDRLYPMNARPVQPTAGRMIKESE